MSMSEEEKREIVEFKDDDTPEIRGMKSYWQMVLAMPPEERKVFYQEERVADEEQHLQRMINSNYKDDEFAAEFIRRAKSYVQDYEMYKDEQSLVNAELCADIAKSTKANKYTLKDIRKQREKIWQEKRKLKTMQQNAESSQSSSLSRT